MHDTEDGKLVLREPIPNHMDPVSCIHQMYKHKLERDCQNKVPCSMVRLLPFLAEI